MRIENLLLTVLAPVVLCSCAMGTITDPPKDYEVFAMGENQYLLRTSVGIFKSGMKSAWHKKAKEICKEAGYEGAPKIYESYGATQFGPGMPLTGAKARHKVAAGPVKCLVNAKL